MYVFYFLVQVNNGDDMRKILITGARSGLIYPVIQRLKKDNFLYVTVHSDSELKYVKKLYRNFKNIMCIKLDITEDLDKIDDLDIDVLVCNAGVAFSGSLLEVPMDMVYSNFEVNVFSNLKLIQKVFRKMYDKGCGRIVIISSLASKMPILFLGSYSASKAALSMMSVIMALESKFLASNVDFVLVEPGLYKTGFNRLAFDKKYDFMDNGSFFDEQIKLIRKSEDLYLYLFEKRSLKSISNKIYKAIISSNPHFRYSVPFLHNLFAKIINLFY